MIVILQTVLFIILSAIAGYLAFRGYRRVYRNIRLGQAENLTDNPSQRWRNMALVAFGQKKMFKNVTPAILHVMIYVGFVITQIELIEIFIDGFTAHHRIIFHAVENIPVLRGIYVFAISTIEVLSIFVLIATVSFLTRRWILRVPRLNMPELKGWPIEDATIILVAELYLLTCIFSMNTGDMAMHHGEYGFLVSGMLMPLLSGLSPHGQHVVERMGWWGHIVGVMAFLVYLPYSKHLHILLAFPNTYYARLNPKGYIGNMPQITKEIKLMMNPDAAAPAETSTEPVKFGAKDIFDLSWKNLLDAYTCTECGRCTANCPANLTGKKLSPRKIMMNTRDRMEEIGRAIEASPDRKWKDDGKSLIENGYISVEELRACTTCNACVEECPVMISPLDIIVQLRRNLVMEESNAPAEWTGMFSNMENNGAPWQFSQQDRLNWEKA